MSSILERGARLERERQDRMKVAGLLVFLFIVTFVACMIFGVLR